MQKQANNKTGIKQGKYYIKEMNYDGFVNVLFLSLIIRYKKTYLEKIIVHQKSNSIPSQHETTKSGPFTLSHALSIY